MIPFLMGLGKPVVPGKPSRGAAGHMVDAVALLDSGHN
jgi:hypothetical protein